MGYAHAKIILKNPRLDSIKPIEVDALADMGSLHLCLPEHVAIQLKLEEMYKREVTTADGKKHLVPHVGPQYGRTLTSAATGSKAASPPGARD